MPRDTPPATVRKPKPQVQEPIRAKTPPKAPKPVEKAPEPVPEPVKQGPSETIEEAFLRAGATVIEAAPVLRDFQKEAVKFVPSIVKKRPPPKKALSKGDEIPKVEEANGEDTVESGTKDEMTVEKSFATTVEDEDEDEIQRAVPIETPAISQPTLTEPVISKPVAPETSLKRPLEAEKKVEAQPPPAAAPPKRRRMVNAAPDV